MVTQVQFPTDQLHVTVRYDEPWVLAVPLDHRLAGRESVTLEDIADESPFRLKTSNPATWSLATRAGERSRLVSAIRKLAEAHLAGPIPD